VALTDIQSCVILTWRHLAHGIAGGEMKRGSGIVKRWHVAAAAAQLVVVGVCALLGWGLLHPQAQATTLNVSGGQEPPPRTVGLPLPRAHPPATPTRRSADEGIAGLVARVNRDDVGLYRGQWQAIAVIASGTRDYLLRHVLPLLLASARGAAR
jgi:hypothetical protein